MHQGLTEIPAGTIVVRVRDLKNQDAVPDDILVREGDDNVKIEQRVLSNGQTAQCTRLSTLLPAAINNHSPMKRKSIDTMTP